MPARSELESDLAQGLAHLELELDLGIDARSTLVDLVLLVSRWAARMNLTGHREAPAILDSLVLDALALWLAIRALPAEAPPRRLVDLGSGAGFPGLPVAIAEPAVAVELIEARQRRHHFQRAACRELALENVTARLGRIEELEVTPSELVVAQAVGPIEQVVALAQRWVRPGGWLVVPYGPRPPQFDPGPEWDESRSRAYAGSRAPSRTFWAARRRR